MKKFIALITTFIFIFCSIAYAKVVNKSAFVTRAEFDYYKETMGTKIKDLDYNTTVYINEVLKKYDDEGRLEGLVIWKTATQSQARPKQKEEDDE